MDEPDKPRKNAFLVILTLFDLLGAVAGSAPFIMFAMMTKDTSAEPFKLLVSVPIVAIVLLIVAWLVDARGNARRAQFIAAIPLIWGLTVFVMLNAPTG